MKCILMNKNTPVMSLEFNEDFNVFSSIYEIYDIHYAPLSVYNANADTSKKLIRKLNAWFTGRCIPRNRRDLDCLLQSLGVRSSEELLNKAYALSLSDQYWLKEEGSNLEWKAVNFFTNEFAYEAYLEASLDSGSAIKVPEENLYSPNNTTNGVLQKGWIIQNGKRILVKGTNSSGREEAVNEWLASRIAERLGLEHCEYSVSFSETTGITSMCENFLHEDEEILSAYDVFHTEKKPDSMNDFDFYVHILEKHHVPDAKRNVAGMFVVDYLMMNEDRHMKNFGVIRNVDTLEWIRTTPIFDTGLSMQCNELTEHLDFHKGKCKFFLHSVKDLEEMLSDLGDGILNIPVDSLNGICEEYFEMLKCYQKILNLSDVRLTKLVEGLQIRIGMLKDRIYRLECCTDVPNAETIEAIKAVERGEVIGPFDSIEALMKELDSPEEDETLYLSSIPDMKEKLIDGLKTPIEECVSEDEVDWLQSGPSGESKR